MSNISVTTELQYNGEKTGIKLIAFLDLSTKQYKYPFLLFVKNMGMAYEEELECWDNEEWLYNILYTEILLPWKKNCEIVRIKDFKDLLKYINITEIDNLIELFEKAIDLKFFEK